MIRHGTTTLIDHHASPNALRIADTIAEAVDRSGLRAVLCYEVTDAMDQEKARAGIQENVRFIERVCDHRPATEAGGDFGLHASLTLSDATLSACREAAPSGTGFHIHVAEHEADEYDSQAKAGTRWLPVARATRFWDHRPSLSHAVHVDAREIELLAESETWASHQPRPI
jgi:cytosine/adenosine deaminase-related metal-dependent hydrolase